MAKYVFRFNKSKDVHCAVEKMRFQLFIRVQIDWVMTKTSFLRCKIYPNLWFVVCTWLIQGLFQPEKVPESAVDKERERRGEVVLPSSNKDGIPRLDNYKDYSIYVHIYITVVSLISVEGTTTTISRSCLL